MLRLNIRPSIGLAICFLLSIAAAATGLHADDGAKSPEEIFKAKGLVKTGFLLIVPEEQTLHEAVASLRQSKGKLTVQTAKLKDADIQIKAAEGSLKAAEDEIRDVDQRMANGRRDNASIDRHNFLVDEIKSQNAKIKTLNEAKDKLMVSKGDYITAVLEAVGKADAAAHAYDAPRGDKELAAAIDKFNLTAKPKVKLGPSAYFAEDLAFVAQCKAEITSGTIPITTESGVPNVEVLINGQPIRMIWDSGCTGITLSAKTAKTLGLSPSADDEMEEAVIADGSHVKVHVKNLDSIRIGAFTVKHLRCTISSGTAEGADLLGNEFQHLFQFKLDINNGTLQLTPLDSQSVTVEPPSKNPPGPMIAVVPPPKAPRISGDASPNDPDVKAAAPVAGVTKPVTVRYEAGDTELATLKEGVKYFSDRDYPLQSVADEMDGLKFTRRPAGKPTNAEVWVPAGVTIYVLIDSDKSGVHNTAALNDSLAQHGWTRLDDAECMIEGKHPFIAIYKRTERTSFRFSAPASTWAGVVFAAKDLKVATPGPSAPPGGDADQTDKATSKNSANALAGVWFEASSGSSTTLNADGTAKSKEGVKGTWTANADGSVIEIKWADETSDVYRLSHGKWTRYAYEDGKLQSKDEISPP